MASDKILIRGAREHNLQSIDLEIPRDKLVVITGVSGSGKSSLAFDTIYAEGQRRYVESLSTYARQFLEQMDKPDVDLIEGLSPAISIEQKTTSKNPRSTVATVTEIYDYLRLLFARVGKPYCYTCGKPITSQTVQQIVDQVMALSDGSKFQVLAPVVRGRKGEYRQVFADLRRQGFVRVRVDGKLRELEELIELDKKKKHTIEVVVDRLILKADIRKRLADSLETALKLSEGIVVVNLLDPSKDLTFSERLACIDCGVSYPEISPRIFSFNNPHGACPTCDGLGTKLDGRMDDLPGILEPWHGSPNIHYLDQRYKETSSSKVREEIENYVKRLASIRPCPTCQGARLRRETLAIKIDGKSIADVTRYSVKAALRFFQELELSEKDREIARRILKELRERLTFLVNVGLDYLTLDRTAATLAGGEAQRIRLATQIGSSLVGVLYILDEPSIGLHQRDNVRLLDTLKRLRDLGNTVLVVEHDEETIRDADYVIDLGPGAGVSGGRVVACGSPRDIIRHKSSLTGQYLSGRLAIPVPALRRRGNGCILTIVGAREHNLKNIEVEIPLGVLTCVTGVSGSGKSTLVNEILRRALDRQLYGSRERPGAHDKILGTEHIDKVIDIDQSPIGRTPRSNPATYTGVFSLIRELYALVPESRIRGYKPGRFSFNVKGGRCEACQGDGLIQIEMHFLPDVHVTCDVCKGARYDRETLEIMYKGQSIADILNMTVEEALAFFQPVPKIKEKLQTLFDVGLGYIKLGQSATTLSGGEAQRVKLSRELSKRGTGQTLYILDEPTTGLHFHDISQLLEVLHRLTDTGNTVLVIEHNLEVIKTADWIIDLGPEGGDDGGQVVVAGRPEEVADHPNSYTGQFLRRVL
ncbi:MAG: excinuclease ABC subunit A [Candidatus Methylomirabilis oxygeniifera]|uniref:UvrABC system protein A n=1 Tax=Methylomirabilis oxygeniifera TaxID=671143 RepID=D5MIN3_METO1|nr:MAG: excinuclease ABC subunit A [Candidatus Methylomirabilis oxyfera]CBE69390.1 UvrABC system protein A (UvrA protein) (Excinuclease ABC subunit A)(Excinuclease ATPase subunit) [Candidatus Methylomirabilis oxyfera]